MDRRQYLRTAGAFNVALTFAGCSGGDGSDGGDNESQPTRGTTASTSVQISATPQLLLDDQIPPSYENGGVRRQSENPLVGDTAWVFDGEGYILSDYVWGERDHSGTLSAWVNIPTVAAAPDDDKGILSTHDDGQTGNTRFAQLSLTQFRNGEGVGIYKGKVRADATRAIVTDHPLGEWFHITGVVDKSRNELRVYFNGSQEDTTTDIDISMEQRGAFGLGTRAKRRGNEYIFDKRFTGMLDDVRVYETVLTDDQIAALAQSNPPR